MDIYNSYVSNTEIDLRNAGLIERTTHIYRAWTDSIGDVHLDVQIDCTDKDGEGHQWIIPDLCIPMDGIIHLKTINEPKYCTPISTQAWFEPRRNIIIQQGHSRTPLASSEKISSPYYVAVQRLDPPVKETTLEEIEQKLGYKVQIVPESQLKRSKYDHSRRGKKKC